MDEPKGMKTVAVVGASSRSHKFGNQAVRGFLRQGYRVVPINRRDVLRPTVRFLMCRVRSTWLPSMFHRTRFWAYWLKSPQREL
jgi:hypothetical protein